MEGVNELNVACMILGWRNRASCENCEASGQSEGHSNTTS